MIGTAKDAYYEVEMYREALREIFPKPYARDTPRVMICNRTTADPIEDVYPKIPAWEIFTKDSLNSKAREFNEEINPARYITLRNTIVISSDLLEPNIGMELVTALVHESGHSMRIVPKSVVNVKAADFGHYNTWYVRPPAPEETGFGNRVSDFLKTSFPKRESFVLSMDEFVVTFAVAFILGLNHWNDIPRWSHFFDNVESNEEEKKLEFVEDMFEHLPQNAASRFIGMFNGDVVKLFSQYPDIIKIDGQKIWKKYCENILIEGKVLS